MIDNGSGVTVASGGNVRLAGISASINASVLRTRKYPILNPLWKQFEIIIPV
jgi:hypothetical protein